MSYSQLRAEENSDVMAADENDLRSGIIRQERDKIMNLQREPTVGEADTEYYSYDAEDSIVTLDLILDESWSWSDDEGSARSGIRPSFDLIKREMSRMDEITKIGKLESFKTELYTMSRRLHRRNAEVHELRKQISQSFTMIGVLELERDLCRADTEQLRADLMSLSKKVVQLEAEQHEAKQISICLASKRPNSNEMYPRQTLKTGSITEKVLERTEGISQGFDHNYSGAAFMKPSKVPWNKPTGIASLSLSRDESQVDNINGGSEGFRNTLATATGYYDMLVKQLQDSLKKNSELKRHH